MAHSAAANTIAATFWLIYALTLFAGVVCTRITVVAILFAGDTYAFSALTNIAGFACVLAFTAIVVIYLDVNAMPIALYKPL